MASKTRFQRKLAHRNRQAELRRRKGEEERRDEVRRKEEERNEGLQPLEGEGGALLQRLVLH